MVSPVDGQSIEDGGRSPLGPTSPLVQKSMYSLATPRRQVPANNGSLLASMSKNSMLGSTIPSTLRKVSLQREFREDAGVTGQIGDGEAVVDEGDDTTTLTTTITTAGNGTSEINISKLPLVERLRLWRHDAWIQHLYGTAEFVAHKVYAITKNSNDAFWLALVYYSMGSFNRCIEVLSRDNLISVSIVCRYLLARCYIDIKNFDEALDIVGETNPFAEIAEGNVPVESDGGIKLESSMCFLRGKIYAAQNDFTRAKQCFKEAVLVDVKNFEAYRELVTKDLLTPDEEWELIDSLNFDYLGEDKDLIQSLYTLELSKKINPERTAAAHSLLKEEYELSEDFDVVCSEIDVLFTECKFSQCSNLCEITLKRDPLNPKVLPIYISCLHELKLSNKLFLLSHELAEKNPKSCITWFCVATYYMVLDRVPEARKFFSKSSIIDPTFAPAWLGFAHTYALEGEQDQAISAYSTAARFFPGMSLPNLFLGMQYMASNTLSLAEEYFSLAYQSCPHDPVILNEIGVLKFKKGELHKAKRYLKKAAEFCKNLEHSSKTVISIQINLSHTYRKLGENHKAIKYLTNVLEDSESNAEVYCSLGYLYLKTNQLQKAIDILHRVLAINPANSSAQRLLSYALELNVTLELDDNHPLVANTKIRQNNANGSPGSKRRQGPVESMQILKKRTKINEVITANVGHDDEMEVEY